MVEHIESELAYASKLDDLTHTNERLKMLKEDYLQQTYKQEANLDALRTEFKALLDAVEGRMQEMAAALADSAKTADETSQFEILEDEDFEVMESTLEKKH